MRIIITGAGGYIGQGLAQALLAGRFDGVSVTQLVLNDVKLPASTDPDSRVRQVPGSLNDAEILDALFDEPADWVFHLAGITSRQAEEDLALGLQVNLLATVALLERLRLQPVPARLVFTSSIGVFGAPLPAVIDDSTPVEPALSYGTQKRMAELLIADYARRGHVDGRTVRLPGVIARPPQPQKAMSAFSSDILQELAAGRSYTCPVSPEASNWLISLPCCLEQLIHAARSPAPSWPTSRVVTLPAQRVTTGVLVSALEGHLARPLAHLVTWAPEPAIEAQYGNWPTLRTDAADHIGFCHDGTPERLVARALAAPHATAVSPQREPLQTHDFYIDQGDKNA